MGLTPDDSTALEGLGLALSEGQICALTQFAEMVRQRNRAVNLVSKGDADALWVRHIVDSLAGVRAAELCGRFVADVGSGAGFPGVPLAVACPGARFVLVERTRKRAAFLRTAARELSLGNVSVEWATAEDVAGRTGASFDAVTVRAVAATAEALELVDGLVAPEGVVFLWQTDAQWEREPTPPGWNGRWVASPVPMLVGRGIRVLSRVE